MRFTIVFTLAATVVSTSASLAVRQTAAPECLINCVDSTHGTTGCDSTDVACLCNNSNYVSEVLQCVKTNCADADLPTALQSAQDTCKSVGVSLTLSATASSTSGAVTASGTSSSTGSPAVGATSSTTASSTSGTASSTGGTASSTGAKTGATASSTGTSPTSSASSSTSAPATTSSSAATAQGAKAFIGLAAVGLVAIAL